MKQRKLLIVDVAALGWDLVASAPNPPTGLTFRKAESIFPALTCPIQASFRTASLPRSHGVVSNGQYFPHLRKVLFWEQAASLVSGERIWQSLRGRGERVGMMFWQQSLGEAVDIVLSPAPIHKHGGGMVQDCYTLPRELSSILADQIGKPFNLMHYWGPLASRKATDWIVAATCAVLDMPDLAPDVLFTYLPHLDYDLQRHGPSSKQAAIALTEMFAFLEQLRNKAAERGYDFLIFGDYAIRGVRDGAVFPNRALREAGLFVTRSVKGRLYADFFTSGAFAMVDHEVAHIFTSGEAATLRARDVLKQLPGVAEVLDRKSQFIRGIGHSNAGDLVIIAEEGSWFAYPWFEQRREAPDYATHVDIHNKPGYDPCELFFGWPPPSVSMDTGKIHGSHGRVGPGYEIAWATSLPLENEPNSLYELSQAVKKWMEG